MVKINVSVGDNRRGNYTNLVGRPNTIDHPQYWSWSSVRNSHNISESGLKSFNDTLNDYSKHIKRNASSICEVALEPAFNRSQELVPYNTGALHDSGELTSNKGMLFTSGKASITYGLHGDPFYAAIVHDVFANHDGITQWKFLSTALTEKLPVIRTTLQKTAKKTMGFF